MVGVKIRYLNRSGSFLYAIIVLFMLFMTTTGLADVSGSDIPGSSRLIVYSQKNLSGGYEPVPPLVSLPPNITYSLRSPELGFVTIETDPNETKTITNDLLNLPWVYEVERDALRQSETLSKEGENKNHTSDLSIYSKIELDKAKSKINRISNCTIAVIDTGVNTEYDRNRLSIRNGYDWVLNSSVLNDTDGHGSALLDIINSVFERTIGESNNSAITFIPERIGINGSSLSGAMSAIAISHATDSKADIILMGYGGTEPSLAEERAVKYATEKGSLLIAPAGDDDSNTVHYPSDNDEVISVGSVAATDGLSYFSNYGIYTELVAPGEYIPTKSPEGNYSSSGTGYAAALVSGVAGIVKETNPGLNSSEIRQVLQNSTKDLGRTGRDIYYGYGLVQADKAILNADTISLQKSVSNYTKLHNLSIRRQEQYKGNISTFSLLLNPGWNFISLPTELISGKTYLDLFSGVNTEGHTIWNYDKGWISKKSTDQVLPFKGILIYSEREEKIPMVFNNSSSVSARVERRWNLVGSTSFEIISAKDLMNRCNLSWVSLLPYNTSSQQFDPAVINGSKGAFSDLRSIQPFSSFWLYLNKNGTIIRTS
jgi:subtilisin family serine protease